MPIIEKAETEIKKLVQFYALQLKSKIELRDKITGIIKEVAKRLPISLIDRQNYLYGLKATSEKMIREFYDKVVRSYALAIGLLFLVWEDKRVREIDTPLKLLELQKKNRDYYERLMQKSKLLLANNDLKNEANLKATDFTGIETRDIWATRKGYPEIKDYEKLVKERQKELAETVTVSFEPDATKKPISLWQKAELDIRHEKQMEMVDNLIASGVKYAWTSSHPDCSKRCEKWQGKLFDLTATNSELSNHRMKKKVDNHTVYCFKEVIEQVDKYGYTNNIIIGFNCRHKLIPYDKDHTEPPEEFTEEEVKKNREINAKLREYERKIRFLKQEALLYKQTNRKYAIKCEAEAKRLTAEYKKFAEQNGYAWYEWRIKI